ncbi:HPr kinase [Alteromonas sp. KUL42]|uniref:HprK-related kinase A n=1 Tax=Alteromonas sp. KUL42 TaxID=2480797 RepID=UPI000B1B4F7E|nr:HprK-related kinase A [Alteromonas sp. KUL42]GEA05680.1 HPr kinase [Alteromonas sp. KUL42]
MQSSIDFGAISIHLDCSVNLVANNIKKLYPHYILEQNNSPNDYYISVKHGSGIRKYIRPQVVFEHDGDAPFKPVPENHAYASFEWGVNYVVSNFAQNYLSIHAGVVAKNDKAIIFPAPPGSGKSTLTTYLMAQKGWRLLSDEMSLLMPESREVTPLVKPVCLKNNSIDLARSWFPQTSFSTIATATVKGNVAHLSPPESSWQQRHRPALATAVIFPRYSPSKSMEIYKLDKNQAFMMLAENTINLTLQSQLGFNTLVELIENTLQFEVHYSDVEEVKDFIEQDLL